MGEDSRFEGYQVTNLNLDIEKKRLDPFDRKPEDVDFRMPGNYYLVIQPVNAEEINNSDEIQDPTNNEAYLRFSS